MFCLIFTNVFRIYSHCLSLFSGTRVIRSMMIANVVVAILWKGEFGILSGKSLVL